MKPLISIIVPVYNIENYLDDCLLSITNQSYENIEIILVDDGSSDKCPALCDKWEQKDTRIKVIHKKNGGLSSARNVGIDLAQGEYIAFVDSDDFVASVMYEDLYEAIVRTQADIAISKIQNYYEDGHTSPFKSTKWHYVIDKEMILEHTEYLHLCLSTKIETSAWNKLFKRKLFDDVRFSEGRLAEDYLMMYYILKNVRKVVYLNKIHYNYRIRQGGICSSFSHLNDTYKNIQEIHSDLVQNKDFISIKHLNIFKLKFLISTCLVCLNYHPASIDYFFYRRELISMIDAEVKSQTFKYQVFYYILKYIPWVMKLKK